MDFPRGPWKEKKAERIGRGVLAFLSMMGAALLGRFDKTRLPSEHLQDDTSSMVRLVASLFVVMTSLVLGFMINSAKNTYEANNRNTVCWRLASSCWIELDGVGPGSTQACRSRRLPNGTEMRPNAPPRSQAEHRATRRRLVVTPRGQSSRICWTRRGLGLGYLACP